MSDPWRLQDLRRRQELDSLQRWEVASAAFRSLATAALIVAGGFLVLDVLGALAR